MFVTAEPETILEAANSLSAIGAAMRSQNAVTAAPTTGVIPAAADEVSALTAAHFAGHAEMFQAVAAQAKAIHQMFIAELISGADSYAATEAANAAVMG